MKLGLASLGVLLANPGAAGAPVRALFTSLFLFTTIVGGAGCAADSAEPDDDVAVDEAALSSSLIHVLGTIAPGDSVSVPYTATPKYRADSFTAAAGDTVTFKVTSESGGDAFAYILGSTFATIAKNDDASATTKDAEVTAKIKKSGTYYVALRNVVRAPTTFTLSFAGPPPAVSDSPGPACEGALTSAGLAKLFSTKPAAGSGLFRVTRWRQNAALRDVHDVRTRERHDGDVRDGANRASRKS